MKLKSSDLMLNCFVEADDKRCIVAALNQNNISLNNSKNIYKEVDAIELDDELLSFLIQGNPAEVYIYGDLTQHYIDDNGFDVIKHVNIGYYTLVNGCMEIPVKYLHELQIFTKNKYGKIQKIIENERKKYNLDKSF